ncbi:MAG TPA: hypothetical protein VLV45_07515 [Gemmatimonadales bacterium]|nr:hypothetical protein [Gemmatimonadales bacterium]
MVGMSFGSFAVLLIISVVVSAVLHYGLGFYAMPGTSSFLGKVVLGWIGGWLGSPVFGHWGAPIGAESVYVIPAILGCLAMLVLAVDSVRSLHGSEQLEPRTAPHRREAPIGAGAVPAR